MGQRRMRLEGIIGGSLALGVVGGFFKMFTFGAIENTELGENVVSERVAVGLGLQQVSGPALTLNRATVELLEAMYQPGLLLFKHLNVSVLECWSA
jgi:hypothetical protein